MIQPTIVIIMITTLDVAEALSNDTTNHRHHHDHRLDMTLDVAEALSNDTTNHRHHHDHHLGCY